MIPMKISTPQRHLKDRDATTLWLSSDQSAAMAHLDEQIRGQHDGLTPGDPNPAPLEQWITRTYGTLPPAPNHTITGRLRHWQATRLSDSQLIIINDTTAPAVQRLARTHLFTTTPELPSTLHPRITLVWDTTHTPPAATSDHTASPGALPEENTCHAITLDNQRSIEWVRTPNTHHISTDIINMMAKAGGMLPPWLLSGDTAHTSHTHPVEHWRQLLLSASQHPWTHPAPRKWEANAVVAGLCAGLFTLTSQTVGNTTVSTLASPTP